MTELQLLAQELRELLVRLGEIEGVIEAPRSIELVRDRDGKVSGAVSAPEKQKLGK